MKITKKDLRKIIREEINQLTERIHPRWMAEFAIAIADNMNYEYEIVDQDRDYIVMRVDGKSGSYVYEFDVRKISHSKYEIDVEAVDYPTQKQLKSITITVNDLSSPKRIVKYMRAKGILLK